MEFSQRIFDVLSIILWIVIFPLISGSIVEERRKPFWRKYERPCISSLKLLAASLSQTYTQTCEISIHDSETETLLQSKDAFTDFGVAQMRIYHETLVNESLQLLVRNLELSCDLILINVRNPEHLIKVLRQASRKTVLRKQRKYVVFPVSGEKTLSHIFKLDELKLMPNTLLVDFINNIDNNKFMLKRQCFAGKINQRDCFEVLDVWNGSQFILNTNLFYSPLKNLNGKELVLGTISYFPHVVLQEDNGNTVYDGTGIRLFKVFAEKLNFTWSAAIETSWGVLNEHGEATGLHGSIASAASDIGVGGTYLVLRTYIHVDVILCVTEAKMSLLVPQASINSFQSIAIFKPLSMTLWTALWIFVVFSSFLQKWCSLLVLLLTKTMIDKDFHNWQYCFFNTLYLVTNHGSMILPKSTPLRYVIALLLITFILLTTTYCSLLVSVLSTPYSDGGIETVEEFLDSGMAWGSNDPSWLTPIVDYDDPKLQEIVRRFQSIENNQIINTRAKQGKLAIAVEKLANGGYSGAGFLTHSVAETLYLMKEDLTSAEIVIVLPKVSPYTENLQSIATKTAESGIILHWLHEICYNRALKQEIYEDDDGDDDLDGLEHRRGNTRPRPFTLNHLQGAFIVMMCGCVLSAMIVVLEVVYKKCMKFKKNKIYVSIKP